MISELDSQFTALNKFIKEAEPSKIFILVDENTHEYCLPKVLPNLETEVPFEILEIEPGEEMKTIETAVQLWEILAEYEADRNSLLINIGGGVITDLGGFVASTYKRGIKFIHIPTSLLGMCDASIGGKTGIDHHFLKNIIGTFSQPEEIFLFPDFLQTLSFEELRSGFAEMLKHGLVADKKHWADLIKIKEISFETIAPLIKKSMEIKNNIVEVDFQEKNIRKTLNFGHTIGHALESLFLKKGKTIKHGEAIAAGMIVEIKISEKMEILTVEEANLSISCINSFFPILDFSAFSNDEIMELMMNDKKNSESKINYTLINKIGSALINQFPSQEMIVESLEFYRKIKI